MRKNTRKAIISQFLVGLAIATIAGTAIAPLGSQSFNPVLALTGLVLSSALLAIALGSSRSD